MANNKSFKHKSSIPVPVMDAIKPVFTDLTKEDLLQRCLGGYTQTRNLSLNSCIWKNVPKQFFCGRKLLEIGVSEAVLIFNGGQKSRLDVVSKFGVLPGKYFGRYCNEIDKRCQVAHRSLDSTKEARRGRRLAQVATEERLANTEGPQ